MDYKQLQKLEDIVKSMDCKSYEITIVDRDDNEVTLRKYVETEQKIGFC